MTNLVLYVLSFIRDEASWTLLAGLAHALFWSYGYETLKDYGYSDKIGPKGNIPSGENGSGVVPITLSLMIVMSLIWLWKLVTHDTEKKDDLGIEED
mmetsp:Transcript_513/g.679  ORF Transcript_513/g.679 Transcript_513/m.679 type:complete len:97 (+) Transcript_513:237-527(+)|eukprot:CAMPEP_0197233950 /NCGR_PEP_ID=MMETSP1429-20130617/1848_1 /TAXON_ID=49237 /ORGANISM="Chaetoceros  sp., Strain UNC1202" /LENGTH=96 /DNA_ID=CAMNT_0042692267 /DNA_START=222 /DNA_END=512 /DNA_ORIENTATION=-